VTTLTRVLLGRLSYDGTAAGIWLEFRDPVAVAVEQRRRHPALRSGRAPIRVADAVISHGLRSADALDDAE
jgi:hypothetical protein